MIISAHHRDAPVVSAPVSRYHYDGILAYRIAVTLDQIPHRVHFFRHPQTDQPNDARMR